MIPFDPIKSTIVTPEIVSNARPNFVFSAQDDLDIKDEPRDLDAGLFEAEWSLLESSSSEVATNLTWETSEEIVEVENFPQSLDDHQSDGQLPLQISLEMPGNRDHVEPVERSSSSILHQDEHAEAEMNSPEADPGFDGYTEKFGSQNIEANPEHGIDLAKQLRSHDVTSVQFSSADPHLPTLTNQTVLSGTASLDGIEHGEASKFNPSAHRMPLHSHEQIPRTPQIEPQNDMRSSINLMGEIETLNSVKHTVDSQPNIIKDTIPTVVLPLSASDLDEVEEMPETLPTLLGEASIKDELETDNLSELRAIKSAGVALQTGQGASLATLKTPTPTVVQQIAAALEQSSGQSSQITLNPEELGRVRITLASSETGVVLSISAERPETADLMRRNINSLLQDFSALGYENPTFDFQNQNTEQDETEADGSQSILLESSSLPEHENPASVTGFVAGSSGLDLKL